MKYYPQHSLLVENVRVRRARTLPAGVYGEVLVKEGDHIGASDVVAWGTQPSDYVIIDVAGALGLDPEEDGLELADLISVGEGDRLDAGELFGEPDKRSLRRRMPKAPADAIVRLVQQGRVILQVNPEVIEVQARMPGTVVETLAQRGAVIETTGTVMQCAWGNGQFNAVPYDFEPGFDEGDAEQGGLADIADMDISLSPYRGKVVILARPLQPVDLDVIEKQELAGIVAPSMPPGLRKNAMQLKVPVMLTEGFGSLTPTARLYEILLEHRNNQALFDATTPDFRANTRPEIILPGGGGGNAQQPVTDAPLQQGMRVRVRRAPYAGSVGEVVDLPERPIPVENGLRLLCAQVKLQGGVTVLVPRANLESLGEAVNE